MKFPPTVKIFGVDSYLLHELRKRLFDFWQHYCIQGPQIKVCVLYRLYTQSVCLSVAIGAGQFDDKVSWPWPWPQRPVTLTSNSSLYMSDYVLADLHEKFWMTICENRGSNCTRNEKKSIRFWTFLDLDFFLGGITFSHRPSLAERRHHRTLSTIAGWSH